MKFFHRKSLKILFSLLLISISCTKSENPKVKEIEKQLSAAEESLAQIESAIKIVPEADQGRLLQLNHDKQLAISRLERLKENLTSVDPDKKWGTKPAEGGEGGAGGH